MRVTTWSYITYEDDCEIRTLVSITEGEKVVQTVGSWITTDPVLPEVIQACVRTLNAISTRTS
jgi:hypothetical protein